MDIMVHFYMNVNLGSGEIQLSTTRIKQFTDYRLILISYL